MKDRNHAPVSAQLLAAFVDGEVTPSEAERVEAELADSAEARRRLAELQRIRDTLSNPVPQLEGTDLLAAVRERIARGAPPPRRVSRTWAALTAAACLAAAVGVAVIPRRDAAGDPASPQDGDFRAKSGQASSDERTRWAGVHAYSVIAGGEPEPLGKRFPRDAGLLFSYTNLGPEPFEYLMVLAVDARGEVRWCYPAYQEPGTNPVAVRIRKREARVPLAELIHLDLALGPATLYALFSRQPLDVLAVESWLREPDREHARQRWPDTFEQQLAIEVEP